MRRWIFLFVFWMAAGWAMLPEGMAQTRIAKEQIEDAYLRKSGGSVFGDIEAATSKVRAATFRVQAEGGMMQWFVDGPLASIRSNVDLYLDPTNGGTAGAVIVPATLMEFPDFLGDKIHFFSHSYKIGVSPFDLDITSDRNIKFHSDTVEDLMIIAGDEGDVTVKRDLTTGRDVIAGEVFRFAQESEGDKLLLFGDLYRLAVSANDLDFYSDQNFKWHSDTHADAMTLDADTGMLTLTGPLQLPVYSSLPSGAVGELIYLDHPTDDNQDGAYVYTGSGWQKL